MQEKIQNVSPVKQNILRFIDYLGISKRVFYNKTGISRGTLESNTGITEDTLAKFIALYPDVSLEWLFTGGEPMIRGDNELKEKEEKYAQSINIADLIKRIEELSVQLGAQINENKHLHKTNQRLLAQIDDLKKNYFDDAERGIEDK